MNRDLKHQAGFTLVELLVGFAIIALALGLAAPVFVRRDSEAVIRSQALAFASRLQSLRASAQRLNRVEMIAFDRSGTHYTVMPAGAKYAFPHGASIATMVQERTEVPSPLSFFADGSSTGLTATLTSGSRRCAISVAPLTGAVNVAGCSQ